MIVLTPFPLSSSPSLAGVHASRCKLLATAPASCHACLHVAMPPDMMVMNCNEIVSPKLNAFFYNLAMFYHNERTVTKTPINSIQSF